VALARPISPTLLCGNGQAKRAAAISSNTFVAAGASVGINHSHAVADAVWQQTPGSIEAVMRTGAVVATDLNTDCWPDLVFASGATTSGQLVAYENAAGSGFNQRLLNLASAANPVAGLGAADLDGDYRPDLVTGNLLAGNTETYRASASGDFTLLQSIAMSRPTVGFAFGDYSGDAWLDMHAAHWNSVMLPTVSAGLLRNLGSGATPRGTLTPGDVGAGTQPPILRQDFNTSAGFADLDGDGHRDLLIASDWATTQLWRHTGAAGFTDLLAPLMVDSNAGGQAIRDFDNDGRWDWFVSFVHAPGDSRPWPWGLDGNRLSFGIPGWPYLAGPGFITGIEQAEWPWGVCAEDFNNDGFVDLFVENGFGYAPDAVMLAQGSHPFVQQINQSLFDKKFLRARLYINQGNRTFVEASQAWGLTALTNGRGVACLDYDRDGDVDIGVAQNSGPALFYENRHAAADGDNFLAVRLVAPAPNTRALGAVVRVEAGGRTQIRQVSANGTYQGQDGGDLHFGLGGALAIDSLAVTWPDRSVTNYGSLSSVNRFVTLLDPDMLPYPSPTLPARLSGAISAALAHVADPAQQDDDLMITLTWLERLHGIALPYSSSGEMLARIQAATNGGNTSLAQRLRSWRRLFDPLYQLPPADYAALTGIDAMTLAAVHCHQFPIDDADLLSWSGFENQGSYGTTHVLLALLWAIDNDCAMPSSYNPALLDETIADVYAIASAGGATLTDLRLEAMTFLAAAGRHDLIQASWVDLVLNAQQPNGGWLAAPGEFNTNDHTTVLGLWLLLGLAEEQKVLTAWVAQPWDP